MRTLCYYEKGWMSPGDLWQALRSGEELTVLAPELTSLSSVLRASDAAADELEQKWRLDAKNGLVSAFWCLCATLVLFWPPLAAKMPEIVQKVLLGLFGAGILAEIVSIIAIRRKKRLMRTKDPKIRAATRKAIKLFPPPEFYRPGTHFPKKSIKVAVFCLLALLLLNSVVLAFPSRPAVVFPISGDSYITKLPRVVIPGTKWEWRPEYHAGAVTALLVVPPGEKTVWVVNIAYRAWHSDMLQESGPWQKWGAGRLEWLVGQLSERVWQDMPPEMERDERVTVLVEAFSNAEIQDMLAQAFTDHFNEHHEGVMRLSVVSLDVVEIPLGDYITIARSQNKE